MSWPKLGNVIIAVTFASGWKWSDLLVTNKFINEGQRFWLVVVLTIGLILQQLYQAVPVPAKRGLVEQRRILIEAQLEKFLREYYRLLTKLYARRRHRAVPPVRVNVMLPTVKWRGLGGSYLQIYYQSCPEDIFYKDEEKALTWKKGEGTSGWAWEHKVASTYSEGSAELAIPSQSLTAHQSDVVADVQSTLSIPIWYDNAVVGILNLDSRQRNRNTLFTNVEVVGLAQACAIVLAAQCPLDGVEG